MDRLVKMMFAFALVSLVATGCSSKSSGGSKKRMTKESKPAQTGIPSIPGRGTGQPKGKPDAPGVPQKRLPDPDYGDEGGGVDQRGEGDDEGGGDNDDTAEDNANFDDGVVTILGESQQCGNAFKTHEPEWLPGTLNPPAQFPIYTGGVSPRGFQFSDAHDDSVMAFMANDLKNIMAANDCIEEASKELAARISNVDVYTDIYKTGTVKATIELYDGSVKGRAKSKKEKITINLTGEIGGHMNATRRGVKLVQTNKAAHGLRFEAKFSCLDADRGCQTTVIRLVQLTKNGEICRVAYIVQRFGNAHVTMDVEDRMMSHRMKNKNRAQVAQYLGNTANVNCVQTLDAIRAGARGGMPQCAVKRLEDLCSDAVIREPFARIIGFKTWSVLYGSAKFKFYVDKALVIEGPLVSSPIRPVFDHKLQVSGNLASGIATAYLMNNDGAGQLNFELNFHGGFQSRMRFSVSSILKANALGKQSVEMTDTETDEKFVTQRAQIEPLPGSSYEPSEESEEQTTTDTETVEDGDTENLDLPNSGSRNATSSKKK